MRRFTALILSPVCAAATIVAVAPAANAATKETTVVSYPQVCRAFPDAGTNEPKDTFQKKVTFTSVAKRQVQVGKRFTVKMNVVPDAVDVEKLPLNAKLVSNSRFKMDMALPDGFDFLSADIIEDEANLKGFTTFLVNENGDPDPNGRILRTASVDNATIGNGPNSSETQPAPVFYSVTGDAVQLKFPTLKLSLKATKPGTWSMGVRSANGASDFGRNPKNYLTFLATVQAPVIGSINAPTYCTPRKAADSPFDDAAKALFTVDVVEKDNPAPKVATPTTLTATGSNAIAGGRGTVSATVSPSNATGSVEFTAGDSTITIPVSAGKASGELYFPTAGEIPVTARFIPTDAKRFTPSTASTTVRVEKAATDMTVTAPAVALENTTFTAAAQLPAGAAGTVAFSLDGATVNSDVDAQGRATAEFDAGSAGTKTITAAFTPAAGSTFSATQAQATVTVTARKDTSSTFISAVADTPQVPLGNTARVTATIVPAQSTTPLTGVVLFSSGQTKITVPVTQQNGQDSVTATATIPAGTAGDNSVTAEFIPTSAGQTQATAQPVTFTVTAPQDTTLSVTNPATIHPGEAAAIQVSVDPIADGEITATINGRTTTAPVTAGVATVNVTAPTAGTFPVNYQFVPANKQEYAASNVDVDLVATNKPATSDGSDEQPGPVDMDSVILLINNPDTAKADTPVTFDVTAADADDISAGINGYLTVTADGKELTANGQPLHAPVRDGKATLKLTFKGGGAQALSIVLFDDKGTRITGIQKKITIEGGESPTPPGNNPPPAGGGGFLAMIMKFFMSLFGGNAGSSSS